MTVLRAEFEQRFSKVLRSRAATARSEQTPRPDRQAPVRRDRQINW
jgi:hypothetical protein